MRIRADFDQPVWVRPGDYRWVDSPMPGVQRMMLDRVGDEVARATSLVRYQPGATFSRHTHGGGEEIFVLEGAFGDEHGVYPAGSYLRNPIGSAHTPRVGPEGALIWVKLHQFAADDQAQFVVNDARPGVLHQHDSDSACETVSLIDLDGLLAVDPQGDEVLVLSGVLDWNGEHFEAGSWLRLPRGTRAHFSGEPGTRVLRKTGHL